MGLIPEQIWDAPDMPSRFLRFGGPTGAAQPLLWAHSEYVKLHRSLADGKVFDRIEPVYDRYIAGKEKRKTIEVWKFNRQVRTVEGPTLLRIQMNSPFLLHWTSDDWQHSTDTRSIATGIGIDYVDIALPQKDAILKFTFFWPEEDRWEGKDYTVAVRTGGQTRQKRRKDGR